MVSNGTVRINGDDESQRSDTAFHVDVRYGLGTAMVADDTARGSDDKL